MMAISIVNLGDTTHTLKEEQMLKSGVRGRGISQYLVQAACQYVERGDHLPRIINRLEHLRDT